MKILVMGDMHGSARSFNKAIEESKHHHYTSIIQVGDFGLWTAQLGGVTFLDEINEKLRHYGRTVYALGGNHENWDHWQWHIDNAPKSRDGFAYLRSNVLIAPRVHNWIWEGRKFMMVAGAASIDKTERLINEASGGSKGWWPQEEITDAEVDRITEYKRDYLFTHDCSNRTPFGFQIVPDFNSQIHRQRIDRVLEKTRPEMHFHGHMHRKYDWMNRVTGDHWTQTYGLNCNDSNNSWGVLDTDRKEFAFHKLKGM